MAQFDWIDFYGRTISGELLSDTYMLFSDGYL